MGKLEEAKKALDRAKANAAKNDDVLAEAARDFARSYLSFEELAAAAKKATNARHAVGRAEKAVREAKS